MSRKVTTFFRYIQSTGENKSGCRLLQGVLLSPPGFVSLRRSVCYAHPPYASRCRKWQCKNYALPMTGFQNSSYSYLCQAWQPIGRCPVRAYNSFGKRSNANCKASSGAGLRSAYSLRANKQPQKSSSFPRQRANTAAGVLPVKRSCKALTTSHR